jgi:membrane associated rhomboid family serine protease/Zn-finger nucleic acid-binding protein
MRVVTSGDVEVDRCGTCGALWFDPGEIRELTEGRLAEAGGVPGNASDAEPSAEGKSADPKTGARGGSPLSPLAGMHRLAAASSCPRCDRRMLALDFQATGIPVMSCPRCGGYFVPRGSASKLDERFRFIRDHADKYAAMGESMAAEMKKRLDLKYMASGTPAPVEGRPIAVPLVVPLSADMPAVRSFPAATWFLLLVPLLIFVLGRAAGAAACIPGGGAGIPSGTGLGTTPFWALAAYPFFPCGILPVVLSAIFLFVLGRQVEDRIGTTAFVALYMAGAMVAGATHAVAGRSGAPPVLGPAGATAAVLGAYLVHFPNVPITMYGMGRVASVPAYLFACCWAIATLLANPETGGVTGLLLRLVDPAPLSLWGSLSGFVAGLLFAALLRSREEGYI